MSQSYPRPEAKDDVLSNIREARAELEASFAGLSQETLTGPVTDGGWSIKDHLAHIAEWQRRGLAVIAGKHPADGFDIDRATFEDLRDVHAINELLFQRHKDRPLGEVIEDFRATHQRVEETIQAMSEEDLQRPLTGKIAERFPRVVDIVNFNFARHDRVHIPDIQGLAGTVERVDDTLTR
ncbi:MAG: DinB family protein [Guyparkeria sp.]